MAHHEEEDGYYYGFANEGLWPLCHMAHTRPTFRASDWEYYNKVNARFADALAEEMAGEEHPVVLIQDYHFALLPRMMKERMPHARIAIFWHIPWPNPEAFSICPWQQELLDGLLGADLIGFHVQAHCNNFLSTVDRVLEARVDWEHFSVKRKDHWSSVLPFPISVEFLETAETPAKSNAAEERSALIAELGIEASFLGVGVDRVDYTKGILERFQAVEAFLESHPRYQEKFTFIQIGAPSRSHIQRYADFQKEVEAEANRINERFQRGKWRPIVFLNRQHTRQEVLRYYRAAHLCMVTSLHDGMNLVAKEYVAARQDERGVLILSRFTGAARDLRDAIIVNPYDIQSTGEAIAQALEMDVGGDARPDASHAKIGKRAQHLLVGRDADRGTLRSSADSLTKSSPAEPALSLSNGTAESCPGLKQCWVCGPARIVIESSPEGRLPNIAQPGKAV